MSEHFNVGNQHAKKSEDEKKGVTIPLRLSQDERDMYDICAKAQNMGRSEWMRNTLNAQAKKDLKKLKKS
jgi:uncharacterized protein (DUF1778 family)